MGERTAFDAEVFMRDLASRLTSRIQLTTDELSTYVNAVDIAFGADIDYAQLHKIYASPEHVNDERRYSPAVCTGIDLRVVQGRAGLGQGVNVVRGAPKPVHADGDAQVHPAVQRILQKD
ncbi:hypothetical protein FZI85_26685 [Mycobacterium sp. CBMA293]|nr:hypothetical protein [Mycolicibacterium sp. CBMA 360]MUL62053.1 hypothetical protein [Mycolicibacterium sp. CBMA 335]MUL73328.1 hypothetical protein [Mycolicibacterium sp. CBMA 311]MUL96497.1 hypothetical protein [Mycolicibacterium sp. CBMA 230]MUM14595.1 hypothetical protein [Mycolicibacterium sp. CBMA 293]